MRRFQAAIAVTALFTASAVSASEVCDAMAHSALVWAKGRDVGVAQSDYDKQIGASSAKDDQKAMMRSILNAIYARRDMSAGQFEDLTRNVCLSKTP